MIGENFSVKPIIRLDKKKVDGTCPINYQVIVGVKTIKLSAKMSAKPDEWNSKDKCFKESKSSVRNSALEAEASRIRNYLYEQRSLKVPLTIDLVKAFFSTQDEDDFYEFFEQFCSKKFGELSEGTQYHYGLLKKRLTDFRKVIRLSEINLNFVEKLDVYLRQKRNIGNAGSCTVHKKFKAVLRYAVKSNRLRKNPYDDFKFEEDEPEIDYLTASELRKVEEITFSNFTRGKGQTISKDLFLFACYTGLRFSDVMGLTKDNVIDGRYLQVKQRKTKNVVQIPLTKKAKALLDKYDRRNLNYIFPSRTNVIVNRDLKNIASLCRIDKKVHFHLSRHTFASTMANSNVNSFKIMKLLGHRDIRMTQRYVDSNIEDLTEMLESIEPFN